MPRGGSKKGEHRGNAKAKVDQTTPNALMKAAVARKPGTPHAPKPSVALVERDVFTSQVIHGVSSADDMTPQQIMLDNMHRFQNAAYEYEAMAIHTARAAPDSEETRRAIRTYEQEEERNRRIASDEAYKVAPYVHSRRSAIAMLTDNIGDDIVQVMLDEIDRKNREHPMVIEHLPQKKRA